MTATPRALTRLAPAIALPAVIATAIAATGCGATHSVVHGRSSGHVVLTTSQVSTLRALGAGDTAFGLNVLSTLCRGQPGGNVVISPVSLETGLGMTYLGARGATATAMARVLRLPAAGQSLASGLRARSALLASLNRPGVTFTTSNRIWADPSLITNPAFLAALRAGYQAGLTHLPLLSQPEQARRAINSAIASDTRGHIRELLPPGSIPPQMIGWVLTDALYLNAKWQTPFDPHATFTGSFSTRNGRVSARYLNGEGYPMAQAAGWTAVSLPYRGHRLSMLALLPPAVTHAPACQVPAAATLAALATSVAASRTPAAITLPRVHLATQESLGPVLTSLGMGLAFTNGADFSGISPQAGQLAFVEHAATLAVGEKGTVATAATATGVTITALPARQVAFNRPYLLLLRDSLTGEPLMLAWVANPASG